MTTTKASSLAGEFLASIEFRTAAEGGRTEPTPGGIFRCVLEIDGKNHDCALLLEELAQVHPGERVTVPIKLLDPDLALPLIVLGKKFLLKDYRIIATGTVLEIL